MKPNKRSAEKSAKKSTPTSKQKRVQKKNIKDFLCRQMLQDDLNNQHNQITQQIGIQQFKKIFITNDKQLITSLVKITNKNDKQGINQYTKHTSQKQKHKYLQRLSKIIENSHLTTHQSIVLHLWIENLIKGCKQTPNQIHSHIKSKSSQRIGEQLIKMLQISGKLQLLQN